VFPSRGRCPSGQREQTVNLPAYAFGGSNPPRPTTAELGKRQTSDLLVRGFEQFNRVVGEAASLLQPLVDGRAPAVVIFVDVRWSDDDDVEIAVAISFSSLANEPKTMTLTRCGSMWPALSPSSRRTVRRASARARIRTAVAASGTTLADIFGVDDVVAATLIGHTGDIGRFPTADRFAAYNGTAPIKWPSGNPKRPTHRLSRRGNRAMNHACTSPLSPSSATPTARAEPSITANSGKATPQRSHPTLKRRLSTVVYRHQIADVARRH
jgi:hypothetical protein